MGFLFLCLLSSFHFVLPLRLLSLGWETLAACPSLCFSFLNTQASKCDGPLIILQFDSKTLKMDNTLWSTLDINYSSTFHYNLISLFFQVLLSSFRHFEFFLSCSPLQSILHVTPSSSFFIPSTLLSHSNLFVLLSRVRLRSCVLSRGAAAVVHHHVVHLDIGLFNDTSCVIKESCGGTALCAVSRMGRDWPFIRCCVCTATHIDFFLVDWSMKWCHAAHSLKWQSSHLISRAVSITFTSAGSSKKQNVTV